VAGIPTIDSLHRDIALANSYRMELLKQLMTISAALFAFTVTFRPTLDHVQLASSMWLGWAGLGASMIGGLFHMLGWDHFYKSYRDVDWEMKDADPAERKKKGEERRDLINAWRRFAMWVQFLGFIVGVAGTGVFAAANIDSAHAAPKPPACAVDAPAK
jgi:H+/gluconate symporter-like permease